MNRDNNSFELICDIESLISPETPNKHAYLEMETAYHETQPNPFLSIFTRRDKGGGETEGTDVWLNIESARILAEEILEWCANQEEGDEHLFDSEEYEEYDEYDESDYNEQGFIYGKADGINHCPQCGGTDISTYSQDKWEDPIIWCESCNNLLDT